MDRVGGVDRSRWRMVTDCRLGRSS